jgi:hypothetical protein
MQTNLINSDTLDKTKCYLDKRGKYLGKFRDKKTIVRYGQQAHNNVFKYGNSMDDKFVETPCRSNTPTTPNPRSFYPPFRSTVISRGGRRKKRNSITKKRRRTSYRKSKKNNRRN